MLLQKSREEHSSSSAASQVNAGSIFLQRKLTIGADNDPLEHEANAMAQKVLGIPESSLMQRKCSHCAEQETAQLQPGSSIIQKKDNQNNTLASDQITNQIQSSKGTGMALSRGTKSFMESRFGTDFSNVRVHTGEDASHLSNQLAAQAFTVGNDIYFNSGKYNPESAEGKQLLAHELTHTIQQREKQAIHKSCSDGKCDKCGGGKKDFWITVYFRRNVDEATTKAINKELSAAKAILANCCLDLKYNLKKDKAEQVPGSATMDAYKAATAKDRWRYTADETALGTGTTFDGAKGIPMLVVDDVPLSGGGVTVDKKFDPKYKGKNYVILGLNQTSTPNPNCNHTAHELWHVGGTDKHDPANGAITSCTGNGVSDKYCDNLRALV